MAMIRCGECGKEVSDKAANCPSCGAPVDAENAIAAPDKIGFDNGEFTGTSAQIMDLAKKAVSNLSYRVDAASAEDRGLTFTTGVTMGSWSGVTGTISWSETTPYRFDVSGSGKQNVKGGQVLAANLFDEANSKARKVIDEMTRLAGGASAGKTPAGGCAIAAFGIVFGIAAIGSGLGALA